MMISSLQQRFDQLLRFAANPAHNLMAHENIAAARELVDTLKAVGLLSEAEHNEYRAAISLVRLAVSAAELKRAEDVSRMAINPFDGSRVVVRGLSRDVAEFLRDSV